MLWTLAFDRLGVTVADIYFVDPNLDQGDDGAERGVRLELRLFERDELKGSVYSAVPIRVDRPIWRLDLLETVDSEPGSLNRAHHHPRFRGWEPGSRVFDEELSADPVPWLEARLAEPERLLDEAGIEPGDVPAGDIEQLRATATVIVETVRHLLGEVSAGRAGVAPAGDGDFVRQSWL